MSMPLRLAAAAAFVAAALPALAQTFPPGSAVGLVPPKGMTVSNSFSGFEDGKTGASILIADLPAQAYDQILATFTPEGMKPSGFEAAGPAADWSVKNGSARILRGKQTAHGLVFRKWVVLAKGSASTAMLSVQAPETAAQALPDSTIEAALKTVSLRQPPGLDEQIGSLPFRIGDMAGFRPVRVMSSSALLLTEGPQDTVVGASQPIVVVASAVGDTASIKDRDAFGRMAFANVSGASDFVLDTQTTYDAAGATWNRIDGTAVYRQTGEAVFIQQMIRFSQTGYIRVLAISRTLDRVRLEPRFEQIAQSVAPK